MPTYANTHSEGSAVGLQTTHFYHDAVGLIRTAVHANDDDAILFAGSGCTGAITKVIHLLGIDRRVDPTAKVGDFRDRDCVPGTSDIVVFVGPMEHHSNLLGWRESECTLVEIPPDKTGRVDLDVLTTELVRHAKARLKVGSFSAASNVTGVLEQVDTITTLLHKHGALSMWDYAAAGPHVEIDFNPPEGPLVAKDAVFLSPHKFPGGPGTPGLLVVKKHWIKNKLPQEPGGGTVNWVSRAGHRYHSDVQSREQGALICTP
jgi:selenocysteine lyase/cysteine desulfurase